MSPVQIEQVPHWSQNHGIRYATILLCNRFYDYSFKENQVPKVDYDLCTTDVLENGDIVYISLYSGTVAIPEEVYSVWGEDDSIIINYVASQLPITVIS